MVKKDLLPMPRRSGAIPFKVAEVGNSTRQRVLDASADMFNVCGIEAVSLSQIANALGISPGNLTYHFKKKADLVRDHVNILEEKLQEGIRQLPDFSDPRAYGQAQIELLSLTVRYRFLFVAGNYIISNALLPARRYEKLIKTTKRTLATQIKALIDQGYMKSIRKPFNVGMLVDSIWWQWLGWQLSLQIAPPGKWPLEAHVLADAVLHIFFVSRDYVDRGFSSALQAELGAMKSIAAS